MELSISQLADLTGFDRRTVTKKLEKIVWTEGEKGAHLYESKFALTAIYVAENEGKTFDQSSPTPDLVLGIGFGSIYACSLYSPEAPATCFQVVT